MTGPSSWTRAMVVHPAGCARSSSLTSRALLPSRRMSPWAPVCLGFRGCFPMAHILVCLRIAVVVTHAVARLATDLRDCALVGRDSHPLDGNFRISRASEFSFLSDQPFLVATIPAFSPQAGRRGRRGGGRRTEGRRDGGTRLELQVLSNARQGLVEVGHEFATGHDLVERHVAAGRLATNLVGERGWRAIAGVALGGQRVANVFLVEAARLLAAVEARLVVVGVPVARAVRRVNLIDEAQAAIAPAADFVIGVDQDQA